MPVVTKRQGAGLVRLGEANRGFGRGWQSKAACATKWWRWLIEVVAAAVKGFMLGERRDG